MKNGNSTDLAWPPARKGVQTLPLVGQAPWKMPSIHDFSSSTEDFGNVLCALVTGTLSRDGTEPVAMSV